MLNKFIGMGRLTKDPEMRTTESGTVVTRFTLAINRRYKKEETDFLNVVTFGKTAEVCEKYLSKGSQVVVVGAIQTRSWDGTDGKKIYATEIIAEEVNFVGGKSENKSNYTTADQQNEEFTELEDDDSLPF